MTGLAWVLVVAVAVLAAIDWWAVASGHRPTELVAKPATLAALIAVAVALHPGHGAVRTCVVIGLTCSLAGDVFLLASTRWFMAGLGSFLAAHVAYIVGFALEGRSVVGGLVGVLLVVVVVLAVGRRIVAAVRSGPEPALTGPVIVYMTAISTMVTLAFASGVALAAAGAGCFFASDATLAWDRFARHLRAGRLAVIVSYHLGQAGLVLALASPRSW